jgi:hypothetical protein
VATDSEKTKESSTLIQPPSIKYPITAILDYRPAPSNMALSRVPGEEELYVGGYVASAFTSDLHLLFTFCQRTYDPPFLSYQTYRTSFITLHPPLFPFILG